MNTPSAGDASRSTEQLVVSGMKLTPCSPTMLQARDAIIQADSNAGANRCAVACQVEPGPARSDLE